MDKSSGLIDVLCDFRVLFPIVEVSTLTELNEKKECIYFPEDFDIEENATGLSFCEYHQSKDVSYPFPKPQSDEVILRKHIHGKCQITDILTSIVGFFFSCASSKEDVPLLVDMIDLTIPFYCTVLSKALFDKSKEWPSWGESGFPELLFAKQEAYLEIMQKLVFFNRVPEALSLFRKANHVLRITSNDLLARGICDGFNPPKTRYYDSTADREEIAEEDLPVRLEQCSLSDLGLLEIALQSDDPIWNGEINSSVARSINQLKKESPFIPLRTLNEELHKSVETAVDRISR